MKYFEFLENHPYFESKLPNKSTAMYWFSNEEKRGRIWIPTKVGKMSWQFWATEDSLATHSSDYTWNVGTPPEWFQELVKEASASLEKRDKLRRVFL